MPPGTPDIPDRNIKLVVLGDYCSGSKRDILISLTNPRYPDEYVLTHEFDPQFYHYKYPEDNIYKNYTISLFDTTGMEDTIDIIKILCRNASVVMYLYSATEPSSFKNLENIWIPNHKSTFPNIPFIVVCINGRLRDDRPTAQKLGRQGIRMVKKSQGEYTSQKLGSVAYIECEITPRINIEEAFIVAIEAGIKHKRGIAIEPPGLYLEFCRNGKDFELQDLFDAKNANIEKVIGSDNSPFLEAMKVDNIGFALRLVTLSGGVASLANGGYELIPPFVIDWCKKGIIKELNLNNNNLSNIPLEFHALKHCSLEENPLISLPKEIRREKWPKIKKYLEHLQEKAISWNIRKLMVLGNTGIGKSTIIKSLGAKSEDSKADRSLLDILELKVKSSSKESITFKIWDFAANSIIYPVYKFFITPGAIYTICFNFTDYLNSNLEYWFKIIKEYAGNICAIILLGTHADLVSEEEIEKISMDIKTKFPKIRFPGFTGHIIPINSKSGVNIKKIKETLVTTSFDSTMRVSASEQSWVQFDELIRSNTLTGIQIIDNETFLKWANTCAIQNKNIESLRDFLTKIGTIIYYPKLKDPLTGKMHDLYLLKPSWLTGLMNSIMAADKISIMFGYTPTKTFENLFSSHIRSIILGLFSNYNIIYYLQERDCILIPFLLPKEVKNSSIEQHFPNKLSKDTKVIGRIFKFSQLPLDFFGRLMIWILRLPGMIDVYSWCSGVIIKCHDIIDGHADLSQVVLIQVTFSKDNECTILLRYKETLWDFVKEQWRKIIECLRLMIQSYYPRLQELTKEYIPCSHCFTSYLTSSFYKFSYEECVTLMLSNNNNNLYCNNINSPSRFISLHNLAPDISLLDFSFIIEEKLKIEKKIGEGAFGIVYKALLNNEPVALKELILSDDDEFQNKQLFIDFQVECFMMKNLNHPNIVKFYGIRNKPLGMVIELITGGKDLFQYMHEKNEEKETLKSLSQDDFSWDLRLKIACDIANGLHYLQTQKPPIIHRDLRSPNIFLRENGEAVIGDFGLAREVYDSVGGILASWQWVAPECLDSLTTTYDIRSDIYSFGIVLWELAAIALPFEEYASIPLYFNKERGTFKLQELKQAILEDNLRPTMPLDTPIEFSNLIQSCWDNDPNIRPTTADILKSLKKMGTKGLNNKIPTTSKKILSSLTQPKSISYPKLQSPLTTHTIRDSDINQYTCSSKNVNNLWIGVSNGSIHSFNIQDKLQWKLQKTWQAHSKRICSISYINKSIWSYSEDSTIKVWTTDTLALVKEWKLIDLIESGTMLLTSNNFIWISLSNSGSIMIYQKDYSLHHTISGDMVIGSLYMAEYNNMIWISCKTGKISLFDISTFEYLGQFEAHKNQLEGIISLSPLPLICTFSSAEIKIWGGSSISNLNCKHTTNIQNSITHAYFTHFRKKKELKLYIASNNGSIIQYNPETLEPQQELTTGKNSKNICGIFKTEKRYLTTISQKSIKTWNKL